MATRVAVMDPFKCDNDQRVRRVPLTLAENHYKN